MSGPQDTVIRRTTLAALRARGAHVARPPSGFEVPGADGQSIRMRGLSFFDPDGYFIEANQRL